MVYPGKNASFALYDDDGVSYDYEKGKGTMRYLQWDDASGKLSVSGGDAAWAKAAPSLLKIIGH